VADALGVPAWRWFTAGVVATLAVVVVLVSVVPPAHREVGMRPGSSTQSAPPAGAPATDEPTTQATPAMPQLESPAPTTAAPEAAPSTASSSLESHSAASREEPRPEPNEAPPAQRGMRMQRSSANALAPADAVAPSAAGGASAGRAEFGSLGAEGANARKAVKKSAVADAAPAALAENEERLVDLLAQAHQEGPQSIVEVQVAVADVEAGKRLVAQVLDQRQRRLATDDKARGRRDAPSDEAREADREIPQAEKQMVERKAESAKAKQDEFQVTAVEIVASVDELRDVLAALDNEQLHTRIVDSNLVADPTGNMYYFEQSAASAGAKSPPLAKSFAANPLASRAAKSSAEAPEKPTAPPAPAEATEAVKERSQAGMASPPAVSRYRAGETEKAERPDDQRRPAATMGRQASRGYGRAAGQGQENAANLVRVRLVFIPQEQAAEPAAKEIEKE
jgi:hypothetical protein